MADPDRDLDSRLARLAGATEPLRASAGFTDRVMAGVVAEDSLLVPAVLRFGRSAVLLAVVAALLGGWAALDADRTADLTLATTYGMEEAAW